MLSMTFKLTAYLYFLPYDYLSLLSLLKCVPASLTPVIFDPLQLS